MNWLNEFLAIITEGGRGVITGAVLSGALGLTTTWMSNRYQQKNITKTIKGENARQERKHQQELEKSREERLYQDRSKSYAAFVQVVSKIGNKHTYISETVVESELIAELQTASAQVLLVASPQTRRITENLEDMCQRIIPDFNYWCTVGDGVGESDDVIIDNENVPGIEELPGLKEKFIASANTDLYGDTTN